MHVSYLDNCWVDIACDDSSAVYAPGVALLGVEVAPEGKIVHGFCEQNCTRFCEELRDTATSIADQEEAAQAHTRGEGNPNGKKRLINV